MHQAPPTPPLGAAAAEHPSSDRRASLRLSRAFDPRPSLRSRLAALRPRLSAARLLALAAAAVCLGAATPARAQVVSHGFEDGSTQGWVSRGPAALASSTTLARTGTRSLLTTGRTATWNGPALDLRSLLTSNTTYQISGWVRLPAGEPASNLKFTVEVRPAGSTSSSFVQVNPATSVTDAGWVRLQGSFTFDAPSPTTLLLYLESDNATASYHLDDFTITGAAAPGCPQPPDQSGLETTFENGTAQGWTPRGGVALTPTTEAAASGNTSLRVTGRTASWQGPAINALCKLHRGSKYLIALRARLLPGQGSAQLRVSLEARLAGTTTFHTVIGNTTVTDGAWVNLSTEYTFGLEVDALQLYVETSSGTASFYLDDFLLAHLPPVPIQENIPSLQDVLGEHFQVGAAAAPQELSGPHGDLLLKHYNLLVATNAMKWDTLQPAEGTFNFAPADALADFAREHGLRMRGHTLLWHNQTPAWVFQDAAGNPLQPGNAAHRDLLLQRLRTHIHTVVPRYLDIIDAWDVVNEVIDATQPDGLRASPWRRIIGPDFVEKAFTYAAEVAGSTRLVINDYNTHETAKRDALRDLVVDLLAAGVPIDGVGHQTHIRVTWPSLAEISQSLDVFTALGLDNEITELDVSVYSNDTDTSPPPADVLVQQGYRYRDLFNLFRAKSDQIRTLTFWGLGDDSSWLKTFPITRDDQPLPFDEQLQAKPAYWGIVDPSELPVIPQQLNVTAGTVQINGHVDDAWDVLAPIPLEPGDGSASWGTFKALWSRDTIYLLVSIDDRTRDRDDTVEVFVGDKRYVFAGRTGRQRPSGAEGQARTSREGYQLEAAIPAPGRLAVGDTVRLDLRVTDSSMDRQMSWSDTHHDQDDGPDEFGTFHLLPRKNVADVRRARARIDALPDVSYLRSDEIETNRFVAGSSGAKGYARVLWDAGRLSVFVLVRDDELNKANANPWEQDSVEIFIDADNAQAMSYDENDGQYRINFDNEVSVGGSTSAAALTSATRRVPGGYIVEAAITLDADYTARGGVIGFDVQVNDADATGTRTSVATWNDASGNAYQDPSHFGALRLN